MSIHHKRDFSFLLPSGIGAGIWLLTSVWILRLTLLIAQTLASARLPSKKASKGPLHPLQPWLQQAENPIASDSQCAPYASLPSYLLSCNAVAETHRCDGRLLHQNQYIVIYKITHLVWVTFLWGWTPRAHPYLHFKLCRITMFFSTKWYIGSVTEYKNPSISSHGNTGEGHPSWHEAQGKLGSTGRQRCCSRWSDCPFRVADVSYCPAKAEQLHNNKSLKPLLGTFTEAGSNANRSHCKSLKLGHHVA